MSDGGDIFCELYADTSRGKIQNVGQKHFGN